MANKIEEAGPAHYACAWCYEREHREHGDTYWEPDQLSWAQGRPVGIEGAWWVCRHCIEWFSMEDSGETLDEHLDTISNEDIIAELRRIRDDTRNNRNALQVFLEKVRYLSDAKEEIEIAADDFSKIAAEMDDIIIALERGAA